MIAMTTGRGALAAGAALALLARPAAADEKKPDVPLYTNADLERVSRERGQTGALSTPAAPARDDDEAEPRPRAAAGARGEEYWRHEADRLRERVRRLQRRQDALRERIEERRRRPGVRALADPQIQVWERQAQAVQQSIHDEESRFEERARRAGALPGWLR